MERKLIGRYIVADPKICHGKPSFRGTRILVADLLAMVASGRDWYSITEAWGGKVPREAIAEAMKLANQIFMAYVHEYDWEYASG